MLPPAILYTTSTGLILPRWPLCEGAQNGPAGLLHGQAGSHQGRGWEEFTDAVIKRLSDDRVGLVFLLWGAYAQKKGAHIDRAKHLVLTAPHPSPLSVHNGFFGCRHFSRTNGYLAAKGERPVEWVKDAPGEVDVRAVNW